MDLNLQALLDEREISNKHSKLVRILDKRDWNGLGEIFSEDVVFDWAEGIERQSLTEIRKKLIGFLENCGPTQHLLGSPITEVKGDKATSRIYCLARHQGLGDRSNLYFDASGEYIDEWERQESGWRIVKRLAAPAVFKGNQEALGSS